LAATTLAPVQTARAASDGVGLDLSRLNVPLGARGADAYDGVKDRVAATLLADTAAVRPGDTLRVGVLFELDPGWHIYWRSPGDSGLATRLAWDIAGAEVGELQWPTPHAFREPDGLDGYITTYGYSERVLLFAEAEVSQEVEQLLRLNVKVRFLACEIGCIPGTIELVRDLPVIAAAAPPAPVDRVTAALFSDAAASVPRSLAYYGLEASALYSQSAVRPGDTFEAALVVGCAGRRDCIPAEPGNEELGYALAADPIDGVELTSLETRPHPFSAGDFLIALRGESFDDPGADQRLRGIVSLRLGGDSPRTVAAEIDLPLPRARSGEEIAVIGTPWLVGGNDAAANSASSPSTSASSKSSELPLARAIALALLGGLILNLMPCVLPILAIKIFSITELAQRDRGEVRAHGAAYGAGVVLSMLALAAAVTALRAGGESIGWGFQFQEPIFVAAISAVLVVFALNLFGVFEIFAPTGSLANVGAQAAGLRRSLFEGLLAVVLATPCSAPFLGTAVGFAFAGSTATIFAIFAAIGVGLASPFVLITLVPAWARFVPRAGPWMLTLRAGLGFAVLATVVWLLWVVGRLVDSDGLAALLAFLVAVSFACWIFGLLQSRGRVAPARAVALGALVAGILGVGSLPLDPPVAGASAEADDRYGSTRVRAYDPAELVATVSGGQLAFVYFTADWCITCKVNERSTLLDAEVTVELERLDVAVFRADWTQRDEGIRAELARYGKAGVPLYLVYRAGDPDDPALLPELLTPGILIEALRDAAGLES
jgi:thiol:disulfide interchange protein DsbD